jgi:hypothetical protein
MELERALRLLKLSPDCSVDNLNESFRKLAKTYHPDSNRGRESWAHGIMTDLNLAYETVLDYLTTGGGHAYAENNTASRQVRFQAFFNRAINLVVDGIYTYYQYGLENIKLRNEGVRKFRYRDCIRTIEKGIENLEMLKMYAVSDSSRVRLEVFIGFSRAFYQNSLIDTYFSPVGTGPDVVAQRHYRMGSEHLDYAIKDALFGDDLIQVRKGSYADRMPLAKKELMIVVTKYTGSICIAETLIKLHLLTVFTRVVQLLHKMRF